MMRRSISVTLMATLACAFGLAQKAGASITIDLIWDDTGTPTLTIAPADTAGGGSRSMSLIMTTTTNLTAAGTSVAYETDDGLAFQSMWVWPPGQPPIGPMDGVFRVPIISPPLTPPEWLSPGTYLVGTITWSTSGTSGPGQELINPFTDPLLDGYTNGDGNLITGVEVLNGATLNIIPEPATVSLLGLGLVGLLVAARRRKSEG